MIPVVEACPEIDLPGHGPAGALVSPDFQGLAGSLRQFRRPGDRNLTGRIQAVEMRDMTVMRIRFPVWLRPFQDTAVFSDGGRHQARPALRQRIGKGRIHAQDARSFNDVGKEFPHDLVVHGRSGADIDLAPFVIEIRVLRRSGRRRHKIPGPGILHQHVHEKERSLLEYRVNLLQIGLVLRVLVMLVQMRAEPGAGGIGRTPGRMLARSGELPDIAQDVRDPAPGAIEDLRRVPAALDLVPGPFDQGEMELAEIAGLGRPEVHLEIDIEMIVAVPRGT